MIADKKAVIALFNSGITNYRISQETKISEQTIGHYTTGKGNVGNMKLDYAIKLTEYYKKIEEEINMTKVNFNGKIYTLTEEAYVQDGFKRNWYGLGLDDERPFYIAPAVDEEGSKYEVVWEVYDNWEELEENPDESVMCDWDNPVGVETV